MPSEESVFGPYCQWNINRTNWEAEFDFRFLDISNGKRLAAPLSSAKGNRLIARQIGDNMGMITMDNLSREELAEILSSIIGPIVQAQAIMTGTIIGMLDGAGLFEKGAILDSLEKSASRCDPPNQQVLSFVDSLRKGITQPSLSVIDGGKQHDN